MSTIRISIMMIYSTMKELLPEDHPFHPHPIALSKYLLSATVPPPPSRSPNRTCISVKCRSPSFLVGVFAPVSFFLRTNTPQLPSVWMIKKEGKEYLGFSGVPHFHHRFSLKILPPTLLTTHRSICTPI